MTMHLKKVSNIIQLDDDILHPMQIRAINNILASTKKKIRAVSMVKSEGSFIKTISFLMDNNTYLIVFVEGNKIKSVLKQITKYKPYGYLSNGQPSTNTAYFINASGLTFPVNQICDISFMKYHGILA